MQGDNIRKSLLLMEFETKSGWWKRNYYPATRNNTEEIKGWESCSVGSLTSFSGQGNSKDS